MCFWVSFIRCQSSLSFETSYLSVFAGHDRALSGVPNLPNFLTFTLPQFISLVPQITRLKTRPSFQQPTKHAKANIPSTYPLSRSLATRSFISHGNTLRSHFVHVTLSAYRRVIGLWEQQERQQYRYRVADPQVQYVMLM